MTALFIDTNFYCDIMQGTDYARDIVQYSETILISPIVIGELLYGFKNGNQEKKNVNQFNKFLQLTSVQEVSLTAKTANFFALILHQSRKSLRDNLN